MTKTDLQSCIAKWQRAVNEAPEKAVLYEDARGAESCAMYTLAALLDLRRKCEQASYISSGREMAMMLAPIIQMERGLCRALARRILDDEHTDLPGLSSAGGRRHLAEVIS